MKFDRGFIKWQPFNSVVSSSTILNHLKKEEKINKPSLFPESEDILNHLIMDAYYSKSKIKIYFYHENKIKMVETTIKKVNPNFNTLELSNHHILSFSQIINIT